MKIEIKNREIQALLLFAAKKDVRQVLNGICFGNDRVTATDGARLLSLHKKSDFEGEVIVPIDILAGFMKSLSAMEKKESLSVIEWDGMKKFTIRLSPSGDSLRMGMLIDARYPNYLRVIPEYKDPEAHTLCLDWKMVADIQKAGDLLTGTKNSGVCLTQYGDTGRVAVFDIKGVDCDCLLMPKRFD